MVALLRQGAEVGRPLRQSGGMRLLFVDSNRGFWGMERHFIALATGMARQGHEVHVLLRQGSVMEPMFREARVPVQSVRFGGCGDPRLLGRLFWLAATLRPDWLVANDGKLYWPLVLLGRLAGIRVALFRHQEVR